MYKKSFLILTVIATVSFSCQGMSRFAQFASRMKVGASKIFTEQLPTEVREALRYWNERLTYLNSSEFAVYSCVFEKNSKFWKDFQNFCDGEITIDDLQENDLYEELKKAGFWSLFVNGYNQPNHRAKKALDIKNKISLLQEKDEDYGVAAEVDDVEKREKNEGCCGAGGRVNSGCLPCCFSGRRDYSVSIEPDEEDDVEMPDLVEMYDDDDEVIASGFALENKGYDGAYDSKLEAFFGDPTWRLDT